MVSPYDPCGGGEEFNCHRQMPSSVERRRVTEPGLAIAHDVLIVVNLLIECGVHPYTVPQLVAGPERNTTHT